MISRLLTDSANLREIKRCPPSLAGGGRWPRSSRGVAAPSAPWLCGLGCLVGFALSGFGARCGSGPRSAERPRLPRRPPRRLRRRLPFGACAGRIRRNLPPIVDLWYTGRKEVKRLKAKSIPKSKQYWERRHMATCSCRLRREDYETLRELCEINNCTVHSVVRLLVGTFLLEKGEKVTKGLQTDIEKLKKQAG